MDVYSDLYKHTFRCFFYMAQFPHRLCDSGSPWTAHFNVNASGRRGLACQAPDKRAPKPYLLIQWIKCALPHSVKYQDEDSFPLHFVHARHKMEGLDRHWKMSRADTFVPGTVGDRYFSTSGACQKAVYLFSPAPFSEESGQWDCLWGIKRRANIF